MLSVIAECHTRTITVRGERVGRAHHTSRASVCQASKRGKAATGFSHIHLLFFMEPHETDDSVHGTQANTGGSGAKM